MRHEGEDQRRVPLVERFEIEAAVRAYRRLGYVGEEIVEQMAMIFRFDRDRVDPILNAV